MNAQAPSQAANHDELNYQTQSLDYRVTVLLWPADSVICLKPAHCSLSDEDGPEIILAIILPAGVKSD